jgi:DNA recombination protein RmuC
VINPWIMLVLGVALGLAVGFLLGRLGYVSRRRALDELQEERQRRDQESQQLRDSFAALAGEQLRQQGEELRTRQEQGLNALLAPYRGALDALTQELRQSHHNDTEDRAQLREKLAELMGNTQKLTSTLCAGSKSQGLFGEQVLANLLRKSELQENAQFLLQQAIRDAHGSPATAPENGSRRIPDCVVILPENGTRLVVDSKCNFTAYQRWHDAQDDAEREQARKAHLQAMRQHVDELAKKEYAALLREDQGAPVVEDVVMFVPSEAVLQNTLEESPDLLEYAAKKHVLLVGPMNFMMFLKVVSLAWGNVRCSRNLRAIQKAAARLIQSLEKFQDSFEKAEKTLQDSQNALAESRKRLWGTPGRRSAASVLDAAEEIRRLRDEQSDPEAENDLAGDQEQ